MDHPIKESSTDVEMSRELQDLIGRAIYEEEQQMIEQVLNSERPALISFPVPYHVRATKIRRIVCARFLPQNVQAYVL